jgi:hypothetical protein
LEDLCAASLDLHLFPRIFVGLHSWKRIRVCTVAELWDKSRTPLSMSGLHGRRCCELR